MLERLIQLDIRLFLKLNSLHNDFFDPIMTFISGRTEWLPLYLILLGIIIYKYKWKSIWIIIAIIVAVSLADLISTRLFKEQIQRLRPSHNPDLAGKLHLVDNYTGGLYGFVSSHAANSFSLAVFIIMLFRRSMISYIMLTYAIVVSYSRIYLGVHYPGDILGGALVGVLTGLSSYYLYNQLTTKYYDSGFYKKNRKI
jgi:undecaprenyl-diphosphatase